jgi:hypothetical protein
VSSHAGKIVNIRHLERVVKSINDWYDDRGLLGAVSGLLGAVNLYVLLWN